MNPFNVFPVRRLGSRRSGAGQHQQQCSLLWSTRQPFRTHNLYIYELTTCTSTATLTTLVYSGPRSRFGDSPDVHRMCGKLIERAKNVIVRSGTGGVPVSLFAVVLFGNSCQHQTVDHGPFINSELASAHSTSAPYVMHISPRPHQNLVVPTHSWSTV